MHQLLSENSLKQKFGGTALVPMLVDEDMLVSFCTFAPKDFINRITMELLPAKHRHCSLKNTEKLLIIQPTAEAKERLWQDGDTIHET